MYIEQSIQIARNVSSLRELVNGVHSFSHSAVGPVPHICCFQAWSSFEILTCIFFKQPNKTKHSLVSRLLVERNNTLNIYICVYRCH